MLPKDTCTGKNERQYGQAHNLYGTCLHASICLDLGDQIPAWPAMVDGRDGGWQGWWMAM